MLTTLLPLLSKLGLGSLTRSLGREQVEKRMRKGMPGIKERLEREKITPQELSDSDTEKRHLIRVALYWLWKSVVKSGTAADAVRDAHDDSVVALVLPAVSAGLTTEALLEGVLVATLDVMF